MTNKAYIVANEEQEREVLEKLERRGYVWTAGGEKPTEWSPSRGGNEGDFFFSFPYTLKVDGEVSWRSDVPEYDEEIIYDGRKMEEEQMSNKYVVSQEFMNALEEWNNTLDLNDYGYKIFVGSLDIYNLPVIVSNWWANEKVPEKENNNRLIAIIRWVNGEDVFEVEKPKKWVVRSKEIDDDGDYGYVLVVTHGIATNRYNISRATKFDTKEEAQSWANSHQEVIEVEE